MTSTGAARRVPGRSFTGLLWALVPVLVILVLIVGWQQIGDRQPVETLDPTGDVGYAQSIAPVPFPGLAGLPAGWRATSSRVEAPAGEKKSPVTLTIGYVTPADRFAQVVVTDQVPGAVLNQVAGAVVPAGVVPAGGADWDRYHRSPRGETVLLRQVGAASVLVTGDAPDTDLATLAAAVRGP